MNVEQLAKEYIVNKNYDDTEFKKSYGIGASASQIDFGYTFAVACNTEVMKSLKDSTNIQADLKEPVKSYAKALSGLNDSEFAFGLDILRSSLLKEHPSLGSGITLNADIKNVLVEAINEVIPSNIAGSVYKTEKQEITEPKEKSLRKSLKV